MVSLEKRLYHHLVKRDSELPGHAMGGLPTKSASYDPGEIQNGTMNHPIGGHGFGKRCPRDHGCTAGHQVPHVPANEGLRPHADIRRNYRQRTFHGFSAVPERPVIMAFSVKDSGGRSRL